MRLKLIGWINYDGLESTLMLQQLEADLLIHIGERKITNHNAQQLDTEL
jgi:hypothetical protein